ncbi:MAG: DUF4258 domain-containing protein [Chloroflexi bacterium]|nr:DUF4258 domain-containing protein [Chloroflexota bacterium]
MTFTNHARAQMVTRDISEAEVLEVLSNTQQTITAGRIRRIIQNRYFDSNQAKEMILRVVVDSSDVGQMIVSVYRTSRISKYWLGESFS